MRRRRSFYLTMDFGYFLPAIFLEDLGKRIFVEDTQRMQNHFSKGLRDGVPIGLGYLSVSVTFGVIDRKSVV